MTRPVFEFPIAAFRAAFLLFGPVVWRGFRISVPALWRLSHCGVDAQDSPLCVSGGCHIGRGGGVGGFVVGLFSGFLCVAGVVAAAMCE